MADEEQEITLRNGARVNLRHALIELRRLRRLQEMHPEHFEALRQLVHAEARSVSHQSREYLRTHGNILPDGTVRPIVQAVLLSSCSNTPEGAVLVPPFANPSEADRHAIDRIQQGIDAEIDRTLNDLRSGHDGPSLT